MKKSPEKSLPKSPEVKEFEVEPLPGPSSALDDCEPGECVFFSSTVKHGWFVNFAIFVQNMRKIHHKNSSEII